MLTIQTVEVKKEFPYPYNIKFPYPYTRYTLAQVDQMLHDGQISQAQYEDYCAVWQTSVFRFSKA